MEVYVGEEVSLWKQEERMRKKICSKNILLSRILLETLSSNRLSSRGQRVWRERGRPAEDTMIVMLMMDDDCS